MPATLPLRAAPTAPAPLTSRTRLTHLDGLRGVAALAVVFHHFFCAFLPQLVPALTASPSRIADTPLGVLYNGHFAVAVFFVLSGFVVSNSAARNRDPLWLTLLLRYFRLALPALASLVFAWTLLAAMPNAATRLAAVLHNDWLTWSYHGSIPSLWFILGNGALFGLRSTRINNVLWTMPIELIGSWMLYILYAQLNARLKSRSALPILCVLAALCLPTALTMNYIGFFLGAILRELWAADRLPSFHPTTLFFAGLLLGFPAAGFAQRLHLPHLPALLEPGNRTGLFYALGALLVVYGCVCSAPLQRAFSVRPIHFLGETSFALYLFHVPLLYTAFAAMALFLVPISPLQLAAVLLLFMAAALLLGSLGTRFVDKPVLALNARLRRAWRSRTS